MIGKPLVFFIVGPTASGKTKTAVHAALSLGGEVISADSIQIYRGLDKGTSKPTEEEKKGVPHHLIDIVDFTCEDYNAACFKKDAEALIRDIAERGRIPIVAGGTGLYVNSILFPLDFTAVKPDEEIRNKLLEEEALSPGSLYARLEKADPVSAGRLHRNDLKRIVRALEVYESTGVSLTDHGGDFSNRRGAEIDFFPVIAGINMDRALLYDRINRRVDGMLSNGLVEEARDLYNRAGRKQTLSLQAIGYKQLIAYFNGEATYDEAVELIKRDTRRYAKRQISWFKRDDRIRWFSADDYYSEEKLCGAITDYFKDERNKYEREQQA